MTPPSYHAARPFAKGCATPAGAGDHEGSAFPRAVDAARRRRDTGRVLAFVMGLIAIVRGRERALLVYLTIPLGLLILALAAAELLWPH